MSLYTVKFYQGDYEKRQRDANADGCHAYVEHHFNASQSASADYCVVITGASASQISRNWGRWYAQAVGREFDVPVGGDQGICVGGFNGRGDFNLRFTNIPALLVEPLFATNPVHAEWMRSEAGQTRLARVLCESIQRFFQKGGLIGFSVGHKYKTSRPEDRGCAVCGGGCEADCAEAVLLKAKTMLEALQAPQESREIRIAVDGQVVWSRPIDFDAEVSWDGVRGLLNIGECGLTAETSSLNRPQRFLSRDGGEHG